MGQLCKGAAEHDAEGAKCILSLAFYESFECNGHLAVAFELMKCDLGTALTKYGQPLGGLALLPSVRNFGRDMFLALRVLRLAGLIHCDVKPENLLLSRDGFSIKLADFGSAMGVDEWISTEFLQPRYYRSPEVMLGQRYTTAIDVWSAGATLFDLATGRVLFEEETNNSMLRAFLDVCGAFPTAFSTDGRFASKHFHKSGDFLDNNLRTSMESFSTPKKPLARLLTEALRQPARGITASRHEGSVRNLTDFMGKCLTPDPAARITPEVALTHTFFQKGS